jgi:hypothetical protein
MLNFICCKSKREIRILIVIKGIFSFTGLTRKEIMEMQKVHEHIIENVEALLKKP